MKNCLVALCLCAVLLCAGLLSARLEAASARVIAVNVDGIISPITVEILTRAIDRAANENAAAVLLRLNTPGGMLDASREITEKMVSSRVPVIAYVTPSSGRAASAGFFLLEAADIAAMSPGTNTGAASPVLLGQEMDPVMRKKVESDSSAWLRSLTMKRGRNSELAEKTIFDAKAFTEKEALDDHLIDIVADNEAKLFNQLDGRRVARFDGREEVLHTANADIVEYAPSVRERIISAVADPNISFILLALGAIGIYVEFTAPGLIFPGVAGGIAVLLGLYGLMVLPINWIGAALLVLGMSFFVLEAKFTSHGILGTGGAVAMTLGAVLLINGPPELRIRLSTALAVTIPFALITMFLVTIAVRARRNKVITGGQSMLGELGEARTPLTPKGTVFVHGEYWEAVSTAPVEPGSPVRIVAVDGLRLRVEPVALRM